jgi:hypothetical protein
MQTGDKKAAGATGADKEALETIGDRSKDSSPLGAYPLLELNSLPIHPAIVRCLGRGGANAAIMLNQIAYWTGERDNKRRCADPDWLFKDWRTWEIETGLTSSMQRTAIKRLCALGILVEDTGKFDGNPCQKYRLLPDKFRAFIEECQKDYLASIRTHCSEMRKGSKMPKQIMDHYFGEASQLTDCEESQNALPGDAKPFVRNRKTITNTSAKDYQLRSKKGRGLAPAQFAMPTEEALAELDARQEAQPPPIPQLHVMPPPFPGDEAESMSLVSNPVPRPQPKREPLADAREEPSPELNSMANDTPPQEDASRSPPPFIQQYPEKPNAAKNSSPGPDGAGSEEWLSSDRMACFLA